MKKLILLLCIVSNGIFLFAQVSISQKEINLGEISLLNEDVIDLAMTNLTESPVYILRIETEERVSVKFTSKNLSPEKTEILRVKLNPEKKGKSKSKVTLYFSSNKEAVELTILAEVKEIPKNNRQACPDFRNLSDRTIQQKQLIGKIKKFPLQVYNNDTPKDLLATSAPPEESFEKPTKEIPQRVERTITPRPKKKKKERKSPEERRNSPSVLTILFGNENDSSKTEELVEPNEVALTELEEPNEELIAESENTELEETDEHVAYTPNVLENKEEFDPNLFDNSFKPNNIIFLIDASTSMRQDEKMDILKTAMIELLAPLRAIDYLSIVTYSGEASVILPPTSGVNKKEIEESINNIMADGGTHAVKGIKKAIQVGKANFIENGNNQIFLASDGAFSIGRSQSMRRKIKSTANDGLSITVLGIKNEKWTDKSLKEIAELGDGSLIKIKNMNGASKVLEIVKEKSSN